MLTLSAATYRYPGAAAESLSGVSLVLPEGSVTGVVGAAESGLSTLCLVLSGLAPRVVGGHLRGSLLVDGEDAGSWPMHRLCESVVLGVGRPASQLSMVAETVYEEVAFGPANLGLPRSEVMARTDRALDQVAISHLASRDPRRLSVGEQQLVVITGLLAMRARHLVLDEPVAHLDARGRGMVMRAIAAVAAACTAVLLATRSSDVVSRCCTSVLVMADGRIEARGAPADVLADPATWALGIAEPPGMRLERLLAAPRSEAAEPPGSSTLGTS
jgi:energy-coupling factor transporter ATP-binding protein EcfA2